MIIHSLFGWVKSLLQDCSHQNSVDRYVTSKHPTTTAEVEYWLKEYDNHARKEWLL